MKEKHQYEILKFDRIIVKSERSNSPGKGFIWFYIDFSSIIKADLFSGIAFFQSVIYRKAQNGEYYNSWQRELLCVFERAYKNDEVTRLKSAGQISVGVGLFLTQWGDCFTDVNRRNISHWSWGKRLGMFMLIAWEEFCNIDLGWPKCPTVASWRTPNPCMRWL